MTSPPDEPAPDPSATRTRPPGTWRIGTLMGSDVLITASWFAGAALITFFIAPWIRQHQPQLGGWSYVAAFAFTVVLYLSVLLHEASHAAAARHYRIPVLSVTLHFLGGHTQIEAHARSPRQEFVIAVVGPITSIVIGVAGLGLAQAAPPGLLRTAIDLLAAANLVVGVLNLVPGLPLDGGRVLKALVWQVTGDAQRGTVAAGWGGRVAAVCALLWPFLMGPVAGLDATFADYALAWIIALFLWGGATAAMTQARMRAKLPDLQPGRLARRALTVPDDLPLAEAVRRAQEIDAGGIVTVTSFGVPIGIVNESALLATPTERRPWIAVSAVARAIDPSLVLPASLPGEALLQRMQRHPASEYLVVDDDQAVFGVLSTADVDRAFREESR